MLPQKQTVNCKSAASMESMFKTWTGNRLTFNSRLGLALILVFGIPRFLVVLQASQTGNYGLTSIIFILMIMLPYVLLTKQGRHETGMVKPGHWGWLFYGLLAGVILSLLVGFAGQLLYNQNPQNWYVYISRSYTLPEFSPDGPAKFHFFLIFAVIGMTFSPFGEELLYRGIIHQSFKRRFSDQGASVIDSAAFSITHLAHFGFIYVDGSWSFTVIPSLLWMFFMFVAGRLFFVIRQKSGSVLGAIATHAGFNLGMTWYIFYVLL